MQSTPTLPSRIRDSGSWNHVDQIQYPEIKTRRGDTIIVIYCRSNKGYKS